MTKIQHQGTTDTNESHKQRISGGRFGIKSQPPPQQLKSIERWC